jgi:hypothetical protein
MTPKLTHYHAVRSSALVAVFTVAGVVAGCGSQTTSLGTGTDRHPATNPASTHGVTTTRGAVVTTTATTAPRRLPGQGSPTALAATLTRVERGLRQPTAATNPTLGRAQQSAYGALSAHPAWRGPVITAVAADVRAAVYANVNADAALDALLTSGGALPTALPAVTIHPPSAPAQLLADYHDTEAATGVPWAYLAAINFIESRFGRDPGQSTAGAQGPMQFEPATWRQYGGGGNINDDHDAILAAGRYLAASGGAANIARAVFAYNNSHQYVQAVQDYATVMLAAPGAFYGYYHWQVYFKTTAGTYLLPEGYPSQPAVRQAG